MCSAFYMETYGKSSNSHKRRYVPYNGLWNQGATCYLNAVLQSLFMTPEFRKKVLSEHPCGEVLVELQDLFKALLEKPAKTQGMSKSLDIKDVFKQQDAVEYYRKILQAVGSHASQVFRGKMSNITKCGKCGKQTQETNKFISLLLSIDVGNYEKYDVNEGLESFEKHSILDEDDWMYCDSEECNCKTETETWSEIEEYPAVLALHLKRFNFDYMWMRYQKNDCCLDLPLSLPEKKKRPAYDLYGVINHMGGFNGGHYNAVMKSEEGKKWYCFDDLNVTEAPEPSLENTNRPYMLLYRKRGFNVNHLLNQSVDEFSQASQAATLGLEQHTEKTDDASAEKWQIQGEKLNAFPGLRPEPEHKALAFSSPDGFEQLLTADAKQNVREPSDQQRANIAVRNVPRASRHQQSAHAAVEPTTTIMGDSAISKISVEGKAIYISQTTVSEIKKEISKHKTRQIIIQVMGNDASKKQSELLKRDLLDLFQTLKTLNVLGFVSGPLPKPGTNNLPQLCRLNTWLQENCWSQGVYFIENFNHFSYKRQLFSHNGVHLNRTALSLLQKRIFSFIHLQ